jgi:hypothetical protein
MKRVPLAILLCLAVATSVGCTKEADEDDAVVQVSTKETISVPNLEDFSYHIIINSSGDRVLQDNDGNEISASDDGKFYDADGNEIQDYEDLTGDAAVADGDGDSNDDSDEDDIEIVPVTLENGQTPEEFIKAMEQEENKVLYQNPLQDTVDFDNANEAVDYNPYASDTKATSGTRIEQTLFTTYGIPIDGEIVIDSAEINGSSATCKITINYDYSETFDSVVDGYDSDEDAKQAISSDSVSCSIVGKTSSGMDVMSNQQDFSVDESGSTTLSFNVSTDEDINEIYLYIGTEIIAIN